MSYALGPFAVDYEARVDHAELRRTRAEKTRVAMAEQKLDVVLV